MKRDNLLIVAASAVIISAFLIILTLSQQQTIQSLTTQISANSPIPTTTPDPTADWLTYTNTNYGFEFKYPQKYQSSQEEGREFKTIHSDDYYVDREGHVNVNGTAWFYISLEPDCNQEVYLNKRGLSNVSIVQTNIQTDPGQIITIFSYPDWPMSPSDSSIALVENLSNEQKCLQITCSSSQQDCYENDLYQEFKQILSTFKFLDDE